MTIESFNSYVSCDSNLKNILFIIDNFPNDYSVFLYDPLIIFNQLFIYIFDYNFLHYIFDVKQKSEIFDFYSNKYLINTVDFSSLNKIAKMFFFDCTEQLIFENIFLILINIYSLFYRINFEIYLKFYSIEINNFLLTIDSLLKMDMPREFSLSQFDLSKSKQVEKICNGIIKSKNRYAFFIAFTFYLLPV